VLTVSYEAPNLIFSVEDTGIGINQKLSDAIFEPLVQADTSLTRRHQGYFLGSEPELNEIALVLVYQYHESWSDGWVEISDCEANWEKERRSRLKFR
jgi:signal transduction histidine kinase